MGQYYVSMNLDKRQNRECIELREFLFGQGDEPNMFYFLLRRSTIEFSSFKNSERVGGRYQFLFGSLILIQFLNIISILQIFLFPDNPCGGCGSDLRLHSI